MPPLRVYSLNGLPPEVVAVTFAKCSRSAENFDEIAEGAWRTGDPGLVFIDKIPFLGRLPGDIYIRTGKATFYFPFVTCILISIILSVIFWILSRK